MVAHPVINIAKAAIKIGFKMFLMFTLSLNWNSLYFLLPFSNDDSQKCRNRITITVTIIFAILNTPFFTAIFLLLSIKRFF